MKGSIDPAMLTGRALVGYAHRCGYTLGLAHSRAGDPDVILGYAGKGAALADAMWKFSEAYADQTERDYGRFIEAIHEGRIKAAEREQKRCILERIGGFGGKSDRHVRCDDRGTGSTDESSGAQRCD